MERNIKYLSLKAVNAPYEEEIKAEITKVVESGRYLQGEAIEQFEQAYAQFIGSKHCISCGNGLDALKLILMGDLALGRLHRGDEVIVPANTYIATIIAISSVGLKPVLADVSPISFQLSGRHIKKHITPKTKAIMLVHLYGRLAYSNDIFAVCKEYKLRLYEDNAQAFGCTVTTSSGGYIHTGNIGHAAAHSFYPSKNLGALGDAGAVTTNDPNLAQAIRALHDYGRTSKDAFGYQGINSRMDEIQAAVLNVKLRHPLVEKNSRILQVKNYLEGIKSGIMKHYNPFLHSVAIDQYVAHIVPFMTPWRDQLKAYLADKGIETLIHYPIPPHKQRCYPEWNTASFPVTELIASHELSLPCNSALTEGEQEYIIEKINQFYTQKGV